MSHDALLFTIDAMDQPIECIGDLMEAAEERRRSNRCYDRAPAANPQLVR